MAFLDNIVTEINDAVKSKLTAFPVADYFGITYSMPKKDGKRLLYLPAIIDFNGEAKWVTFDDIRDLTLYHKINTSTYSQIKSGSYGDGYDYIQQSYEMDLIVMSDRKKVNVQPDTLEMAIGSNIPSKSIMSGFEYINITATSSNHSSRNVFATEFSGVDYFLKPEHILFSIRYRVELRYQKGCISLCQCN